MITSEHVLLFSRLRQLRTPWAKRPSAPLFAYHPEHIELFNDAEALGVLLRDPAGWVFAGPAELAYQAIPHKGVKSPTDKQQNLLLHLWGCQQKNIPVYMDANIRMVTRTLQARKLLVLERTKHHESRLLAMRLHLTPQGEYVAGFLTRECSYCNHAYAPGEKWQDHWQRCSMNVTAIQLSGRLIPKTHPAVLRRY